MEGILLLALLTFGGLGLFLAMPSGRTHAGRAAMLLLIIAAAIVTLLLLQAAGEGGHRAAVAILALIGLGAATRVITHPKPVYSALYFILVIVATCGLLLLAQAEFLAAATLIIYGGAILVTYVFVIMLAQQSGGPPEYDRNAREPFFGVLAGMLVLAALCGRLLGAQPASDQASAAAIELAGTVTGTGTVLLTEYAVGVQIAAILLLAALVGAVAIARRRATMNEEAESF